MHQYGQSKEQQMRLIPFVCGFAALALAPAAAAVTLAPVSFSPQFEEALQEDLGAREGNVLREDVEGAVTRALAERGVQVGGGGGTIEIVIVDADPNRPTMEQLADQPGLDSIRSISIGGAELHAVLRGANGEVVTEVDHRGYDHTIEDASMRGSTTWSRARQAIRRFANDVADAYVAHAGR
jgi:hypothetical protein